LRQLFPCRAKASALRRRGAQRNDEAIPAADAAPPSAALSRGE
jgi:hypothetical protein